ncbi:hypothetical protein FCH28_11950 [Streptomyces piniterrae]|uniref:Uncharacterized protein n=1 Tax=Streptomyces piniterrae TaxID=2571125 RepID=A0A4U0NNR3_9ACTN|nr:hypothetical protein [Streptomyces piniterrae]TJZ55973.1 hypothetical protein FCH28_11950 [Streptomyces piniterrae]
MTAPAVWLGRCVTVVGLPALLVLTAGWLFLDAGPVRTGLVWGALAALILCVLTLTGYVLKAGLVSGGRAYELALDAAHDPAAVPGAALPAKLHGSAWTWVRITAAAVAVPTALVLGVSLAAGDPDRGRTAARIADAGYVIRELPVVAVGNVERAGSSPRASAEADYTVRPPSSGGGGGERARVTFRAETPTGVGQVGDTFSVAYAPSRPELGAVGALRPADVRMTLAGRTLPSSGFVIAVAAWALFAGVAPFLGLTAMPLPRRARTVGKDWITLRATVTGLAEHVEPPPGTGDNGGRSTGRYACLTLRTEAGDVPLNLAASHKHAAPLLVGRVGWLVWHTTVPKRKAAADFVADDGWQLPGRVPAAEAARIAARPRGPVPIDAARRVRLLELGGHWPRTVPVSILLGVLIWGATAGALLLPAEGGWRVWTAVAGALAPLALWALVPAEPAGRGD